MRIDIPDQTGRARFTVEVDLREPPAVVRLSDPAGTAMSLDWDRAIDDEQHLRHCPVCSGEALYVRKEVPQVTVFVLIILAALAAIVIFNLGQALWALIALALILGLDLAIYWYARRVLTCYRCGSAFRGMPIGKGQPGWDPAVAERHRAAPSSTPAGEQPGADDVSREPVR